MNTNFIDKKINLKDIPKDSPFNTFLLSSNERPIEEICDFLLGNKKLMLLNGFTGCGKTEILDFICSNFKPETLLIKYMCLETTILDDMLLSFFETFRNYAIKGTITLPRAKVENFTQKINTYFNSVKNPIIIVLQSFQAILRENKKDILSFVEHLEKFENIKIIISSRTFDHKDFEQTDFEQTTIKAFTKDNYERMLRANDIKNIGPLSNELYKQTRGYYNYIVLSVNIMRLRQFSLGKFLEVFSKSMMPFSEFILKETLLLVDPVSLHLFRLLALMRIPIHTNLLKSLHMFDPERLHFFIENTLLSLDGESIYLKDYYREIIEHQIQDNVMLKLHKACVELYETQLPLKPLERDLRLSRQTMRNEIEYHSLFLPKKPQIVIAQIPVEPQIKEEQPQIVQPEKEETKEEKIEKINFIFDDENILNNIADSITEFITEKEEKNELALSSVKMTLTEILNTAKQEETKYNYKNAVMLYQSALNKKDDDNFDKFLPTIYLKLAKVYKQLSDWYNSLEYFTKLQDYYLNINEEEKACETKLEIANIYFAIYKQENAKYILNELSQKENISNNLKIKTNLMLAKIASDINEEFSYYKQSVKLIDDNTDKSVLAELYYRIAGIFDEKDETKHAAYYYKKCSDIKQNNNYLSRAMANLAELYDEIGNFNSAVKYYEQSISIDKENKNYNGLYSSTRHLSEIYSSKDSEKSLEYLKTALTYAKELNEPYYMTDTTSEIGNFYLLRNDFDNAYKYFLECCNIAGASFSKENTDIFTSKLDYLKKIAGETEFKKLQEKYGK